MASKRLLLTGVVCTGFFCCVAAAWGAQKEPVFAELPLTNATPSTNVVNVATNASTLASTNAMDLLDDKYKLVIGDRLSFRIIEDEDDSKPLFVTDSGRIDVPYIHLMAAEGKTCQRLANEIKAELEKDYYHHATVILAVDLKSKSRGRVYLSGPVRAGGPQEVPSDETFTLSKAILRAGGFSDFADRKNVRVTRKNAGPGGQDKVFTVDVSQILEKGRSDLDLVLEPGDLICIPERSIRL